MATSLGFGVLFGSAISLVLVPCLYLVSEDVRLLTHRKGLTEIKEEPVDEPAALQHAPIGGGPREGAA
jgi:hypothetical protein